MEYSNEENVSVFHTRDHDSNVSAANENIDNQEIIPENIRSPSSNLLSEMNSSNVAIQNSGIDVNSDTNQEVFSVTKSSTKEPETDRNDICGAVKQADLVSETIVSNVQITEKYQEYMSVSQEGQGSQSTEYISEYVLESNAENVYVSEVRDDNLDSSEQLHSKVVLDDSHANISDEANQQNTTNPTESEDTDMNETNSISECPKNLADNENWSNFHETSGNQLNEQVVKHEHETSGDNGDEIDDQNVDENINDAPLQDGNIIENVGQDAQDIGGDQCSYNVKEEINSVPVNESEITLNEDQRENGDTSESIIQEQEICSNDNIVENVEMANTADSSENLTEDYAMAGGMEVTEIQGEYTIVEGPSSLDITTNQLEEPMNSEETWVLVENNDNLEENPVDEQNEVYLDELRSEAESRQSMSSQSSEPKRRRGRKPTYDIPMHVLGHDISKPVESVPNGRAVPKPRLGVKVPYRNLTSQIVSKADIEKEVMERVRLKQEQANSRADILFARKLTQRLARKIAPSPDPPRRPAESKKSKDSDKQVQREETESTFNEGRETSTNQSAVSADNSKIHNDSDLLAILEGEGDEMPVLPKEVPQPQLDDSNLKLLEREIALQQLQELPNQAPKHRIFRGRQIKPDAKAPVLTPEASVSSKNKASERRGTTNSSQNSVTPQIDDEPVLSEKENQTTKRSSRDVQSASPKRDQNPAETHSPKRQPVEIEPQVKVNMVLKTYSRKRKTIELPETLDESPLQKKPMLTDAEIRTDKSDTLTPTNAYVTKSSRVIKKKVIWDPDDEAPTRSPKSITKPDTQPPKVTTVKTVKPVEKSPIPEKNLNEKLVKEKVAEKKNIEKVPHKKSVVAPSEKKVVASKSESLKNKTPVKAKKLRSEVDKLLMDEGAVKMLYDLKNNDELVPKKKKDVYSVEKAHKEIMKKANEIKSDLQQNTSSESPKSLRKKDAFTPSPVKPAQITYSAERKMSKDSTRSSVHTPPGSPAYSQSSMLVRRRSSSSISSSDEVEENDGSKTSRKKSGTASSEGSKSKKVKKSEQNEEVQAPPQEKETSVKSVPVENKTSTFKYFTVKKTMKHIAIGLNYDNEECYYTAQVLDELTNALKKFAKEKDCHVVSITSNSKAFCLGLDYTSLISDNDDTRKEVATELAERVREFLQCLLKFPKVLIAGIRGDCAGLGVTMLPLFDMVIASDTATFSTSYASLGCVAEAGYLLSPPIFTNYGLAAELLYNTQKITADDAFRRGLITRLCWPEKYNETFKNIVTSVSKGSKQSLVATKKQLRRHLIQTTETTITSESKVLIEHWTSSECQKNFAQINEK